MYGPYTDVTSLTLVYKWYYLQSPQLSNTGRGQHLGVPIAWEYKLPLAQNFTEQVPYIGKTSVS